MGWIADAIEHLERQSRLRTPTTIRWETATRAEVAGRRVEVFCGNDYLGLRRDNRLARAATNAIEREGTGAGASRLVSGNLPIHEELERAIADWVRLPEGLLVSSGFVANVGTIPVLAGEGDVVFSDALNHASIVDGCRLSRARTVILPHLDPDALGFEVTKARPFRRGVVITESLFSMDGDVAPLRELRSICDREGLSLYVDEAHAMGVLAPDGAGGCAEAGIVPDVLLGTLGKALASSGAVVLGSRELKTLLWNHCRSFVFSSGVSPAVAGAALAAQDAIRKDPGLREQLAAKTHRLRGGLARARIPIGGVSRSPIIPVRIGNDTQALATSRALLERGYFVQPIRPPTVPDGSARLRITVSAAHSIEAIDGLVEALKAVA